MSAILNWQKAKQELHFFDQWAGKVGKPYIGGGGGTGAVVNTSISLTVYHQEYDGATNYHEPDKCCQAALNRAAQSLAGEIISRARREMVALLAAAAQAATAEAAAIFGDAQEGKP